MKRKAIYKQLVRRYMENQASDREREVFFHLFREGKLEQHLDAEMEADADALLGNQGLGDENTAFVKPMQSWRHYNMRRYGVAAAVVICLVAFGGLRWWTRQNKPVAKVTAETYYKNDVLPGGNKAILTLADGSTVALDSVGKRNLAKQGNAQITETGGGRLAYKALGNNAPAVYNKISTPAGGQYQVTLADGTKVWLNALSSLRFPTAFDGSVRTVELTGEAYFEVAGSKVQSFEVNVNGMKVQVLGTQFDVNAYPDESSIKTTLVAGAVKLVKGNSNILLKPGQQAQSGDREGFVLVKDADVYQAVAWKDGFFSFDDANIQTVMRQLARWYGIRVKYEGDPTSALFWGRMQRDLNLTQVLTGLSKSKVHFQLEGTALTVLP